MIPRFTCSVCFAPPGIECNEAPGWCGAIEAPAHERADLENACVLCRGTGRWFVRRNAVASVIRACPRCDGTRLEPEGP